MEWLLRREIRRNLNGLGFGVVHLRNEKPAAVVAVAGSGVSGFEPAGEFGQTLEVTKSDACVPAS